MPIALIAPTSYLAVALVLLVVVGAANSIEDVAVFTLLQRMLPDDVLTRALGVVWSLVMGGVALGSIVAPAVVDAFGPQPALVAVGAILPLLILLTWKRLREIDRTVSSASPQLVLIERATLFSPLSMAAKERLAAALVRQSVAAGDVVVRAGDVGDRFYLVASGELEITGEGVLGRVGEGGFFGEIALLRDVPRTATVQALADSDLYVLSRNDFLAAVLAHAGVRAAGEAVAEKRLPVVGPV